jgi:hypothetical protein
MFRDTYRWQLPASAYLQNQGVFMYVNRKMRPVETIPGIGGRGDKELWWRG